MKLTLEFADRESIEMEDVDYPSAAVAFDEFPWTEERIKRQELEEQGVTDCAPGISIADGPDCFVVWPMGAEDSYFVQVSLKQKKSFLGLYHYESNKGYVLVKKDGETAKELMRTFFEEPRSKQHEVYRKHGW